MRCQKARAERSHKGEGQSHANAQLAPGRGWAADSALGLGEILAPRPCLQHIGLQGKRNLLSNNSTSTSHPTALPSNSKLKKNKSIISIQELQQPQPPKGISTSPNPAQAAQQQISTGQLSSGFLPE